MLHCDYVPGIDEELEREEEAAEKRSRYETLLLEDDYEVEGVTAMASLNPRRWSRQRFSYALDHYQEFGFIWRDRGPKPISMASSVTNIRLYKTIETRILGEQRQRGARRGKLNKQFPALGIDQSSASNIAAGAAHETTVNSASNVATICYHSEPIRADLTALRAVGAGYKCLFK